MNDGLDLGRLQGWMIDRLRDPNAEDVDVDRVIVPTPTMTAGERLDVYRRGYWRRLVECLREMHPALLHLLGGEVFDAFALDYLAAHPPASYSLFRLDDVFADHLAATRPDGHLPAGERESWPDLLVDVARFERAFLEVYDGPGVEGEAVASSGDVPVDRVGVQQLVVTPVPCLRILHSRFPVGEYVLSVRRGEQPPVPAARPTYVALVRRNYVVDLVPLMAASYRSLEALLAGGDAGQAARACGTSDADVVGWIWSWADRGLFRRVTVPTTRPRETTCC